MSCFIDNPNVEANPNYKRWTMELMPDIKKSPYCGPCLAQYSHEVEPIDCPLSRIYDDISVLRDGYIDSP